MVGNEIEAMGQIDGALSALEADARERVLTWAMAKFGDGTSLPTGAPQGSGGINDARREDDEQLSQTFSRISDLVDAANPSSGLDYVLLGSYWFHEVEGGESFTGQQVNSALKDLGHGSANITASYNSLKSRKPPLARQIQKSGASKQARKQYRLTTEGIRAVERMLDKFSEE
jgi:hypothetical protein